MFSKILLGYFLIISTAAASYESAERSYGSGTISLSGYRKTIIELVDSGYYFSVLPWVKDFLAKGSGPLDSELDRTIDKVISVTGVKTFESLPEEFLKRSRAASIRYILAKRWLNKGRHQEALQVLESISSDHESYPFVANLKGTINSYMGRHKDSDVNFKDCIRYSDKIADRSKSINQKNQLITNRDFCLAGLARVSFASKDFKQAELNYLDISKDSFVWPEILFEEAWNSYYQKNYNRTLGKLVSYKAPVFDFIFKPEVEVLKAMTYLKMCLYEDAKKTADTFYDQLTRPARDLRTFLIGKGKDYNYFYSMMADHEELKPSPYPIVDSILRSIRKDAAFIEMKGSLGGAIAEYNQLTKKARSSMQANLTSNIKTVIDEYRKTIGSYVRSGLVSKYAELYSAFQDMSYIKLEVLAQRKEKLYESDVVPGQKRGDVKYLERNEKQYFWTFNGEFWADELGDYVFALRSEC